MNWQAVSFDWNQVRAFLATAEEGSLSAAARALRQSQPTLGRQVTALEAHLGVVLFERVGRSLELTPTGRELLEHVRAMGEAAGRLSLAASGKSEAVDGVVSISASDVSAAKILPPVIAELSVIAPAIEIEIVAENALSDLQRREADIAIRHVRPTEPELFARLLGDLTASLYASTDLLDRLGRPSRVEELSGYAFVGFSDPERLILEFASRGIQLRREQFRATSASGIVAWEMARAGLGICIMSDNVGRQEAGMEVVIPGIGPFEFPVWLAVHREVQTSRRIRLVFDFLAERLKV